MNDGSKVESSALMTTSTVRNQLKIKVEKLNLPNLILEWLFCQGSSCQTSFVGTHCVMDR